MSKAWSARFETSLNPFIHEFNASIHFDKTLIIEDIDCSIAHARMLGQQNVITKEESKKIIDGLKTNGLEVITPTASHEIAGNAAFAFNKPEYFVKRAAEDGILVWGDNNRVRISAHVFTTENDVDVFLGELPKYLS